MEVALAHEKIWFEKSKYEEAEKIYYESQSKLLISDGHSNKKPDPPKSIVTRPSGPAVIKDDAIIPIPDSVTYITTPEPPHIEDKRFKVKNRHRNKKEVEKKVEKPNKQDVKVSSTNAIMKNSLADEVAKARQHIKSSLECVDGIAKLTSDTVSVEITNRLNSLETESAILKTEVKSLTEVIKKLTDRLAALEKLGGGSSAAAASKTSAPVSKPAAKPQEEDDDDGVDLFNSDSEGEDEESKKVKEQRLAEYAARKSKKPVLIAKSNIILDVKPWDDETDMKKMEVEVRKVTTEGLIWGASKLVPLAYGIHKLQISCVVEDDKVSVDWLQEQLEAIEDYVQSVDIAAFNKV